MEQRVTQGLAILGQVTCDAVPLMVERVAPAVGKALASTDDKLGLELLLEKLGVSTPRQLLHLLELVAAATAAGTLAYAGGSLDRRLWLQSLRIFDPAPDGQ